MKAQVNQALKLQRVLNQLFAAQAREVMSRVSLDKPAPDMTAWVQVLVRASQPELLSLHQQGMVRASARIAAKLAQNPEARESSNLESGREFREAGAVPGQSGGGLRTYRPGNDAIFGARKSAPSLIIKSKRRLVCKAAGNVTMDFDLFSPKVLDAVEGAAFAFCRETMDTATGDLNKALDDLRTLMREGLPKGDAIQLLAKKVRAIFADPMRAFRIATTETSRAMHGGQRMAAIESGVVTSFSWLASSDACEKICLPLDGKTVKNGQPYLITTGKPPYNIIWHPPAHPHCHCDETENIG